ncbi:hypothetical protein Tco_1291657 [Tanacetum coccineum]
MEVSSIRRIQVLDTAYWGFLGIGTTLDIFQNIHILFLEYGVLSLSGYGVLSFNPLWYLVHDAIADDILDDLLKREWEKRNRVKYDKRKVTQMKIQDLLEKRIEKAGQHLNEEKQIMHINKGKEKMVMERATSDESSEHNPFQVTSDESYDDTLKSSSEDTCSSDCTWEQKKSLKINQGLDLSKQKKLLMVNKAQALQKQKKLLFHQRLYSGMMI